jgi:predicted acyltransferase
VDVFRGGVLLFLAVLVFTPTTGWRGHANWWGWRPSDLFFPAFLLTAGAGLALQSRERLPWPRLLRRFVSLLVLGLLYNAITAHGGDVSHLRYPGVLQRIGVVGLAGAVVVAVARRRWWVVTVAAVVLCLVWGGMLHHAALGCPGGDASPAPVCGTFLDVDTHVFGVDHLYRTGTVGHDPEGIASTIGALATFLVGFAAGRVLVLNRGSQRRRLLGLAAMAVGWLVVSPLLRLFAPFGKRLWTPVFVSLNGACGLAAIALLALLFDSRWRSSATRRVVSVVAWPFEAVGRNALVLWLALELSDAVFLLTPSAETRGGPLGNHLVESMGPVPYFLVFFGAWMAVAAAMHATRWHVRL